MQHKEQQGLIPAVSRNLFSHYVRKGGWEPDIKAEVDEQYKMYPDGFAEVMPQVTLDNPVGIQTYKEMTDGWFQS